MKKLFLLLFVWLYPIISFSAINECKTDVYFANGILTTPRQAFNNAEIVLKPAIIDKLGIDGYNTNIGKVDYAYNSTLGRAHDMLEAYIQLDREAPDFFDSLRGWFKEFVTFGAINEIEKYANRQSISRRVFSAYDC